MTSLATRAIAALRAEHELLAKLTPSLTHEQLAQPSCAGDWTVAQVLSHLGSGAEIMLSGLWSTLGTTSPPGQDFNQKVWDRWNAMQPQEQAAGFLELDAELVAALQALDDQQLDSMQFSVGAIPFPLAAHGFVGLRLNEAALHSWDVRAAFEPQAVLQPDTAHVLTELLAGDLGFMLRFIGKAEAVSEPAVVDIEGSGFGLVVDGGISMTTSVAGATATFTGPLEAVVRLLGGRLDAPHTQEDVKMTGNVTLDELRSAFPGF